MTTPNKKIKTPADFREALDRLQEHPPIPEEWWYREVPDDPRKPIYEEINRYLSTHYEKVPKNQLMRCMDMMITNPTRNKDDILSRFEIVEIMCRGDRVSVLSPEKLKELVDFYQQGLHWTYDGFKYLNREDLKARRVAWRVLLNPIIRNSPPLKRNKIRMDAVTLVGSVKEIDPEFLKELLAFIFEDFDNRWNTYDDSGEWCDWMDLGLLGNILYLSEQLPLEDVITNYNHAYYSLFELYVPPNQVHTEPTHNKSIIRSLFRLIHKLKDHRSLQSKILENLEWIISCQLTRTMYRTYLVEENFDTLINQMFYVATAPPGVTFTEEEQKTFDSLNNSAQKCAISIFGLVWTKKLRHTHPRRYRKEKEAKLFESLCDDLLEATRGYNHTDGSGYMDQLSWLLTHCKNPKTEEAVNWIYRYFIKLEKNRQEKGRHEMERDINWMDENMKECDSTDDEELYEDGYEFEGTSVAARRAAAAVAVAGETEEEELVEYDEDEEEWEDEELVMAPRQQG